MAEQTEDDFLAAYDPRRFPPVAVTVDVAAFCVRDGALHVLGIERANHPFVGRWALPGAFPDPHEDTYDAAVRAVQTRAGVVPSYIEQLSTYSDPSRDPRMRVVSVAYLAFGPFANEPQAGYHALKAAWLPVHGMTYDWAFDHERMVRDAVYRVQSKFEYTTLATRFLPPTFTVADLKRVYEAVWDKGIDPGNFYRKVKATDGFLVTTGEKYRRNVFQAGPAKTLFPPIRRDSGDWS